MAGGLQGGPQLSGNLQPTGGRCPDRGLGIQGGWSKEQRLDAMVVPHFPVKNLK